MAEKVGSFSVQWSYLHMCIDSERIYWWPSIDPDGNDLFTYSDFDSSCMDINAFGFYFNTAAPSLLNWFSYSGAKGFTTPL